MSEKGFEAELILGETPNYEVSDDKPFKINENRPKTVDINVLKARVQKIQNKEQKKNIFIFSLFLLILGTIGIYFSL
jgi:hypothetical protein